MVLVPGLNVGIGVLILVVVWLLGIVAVLSLALVPKARYGIPVVILVVVVVTLVLFLYPRESGEPEPENTTVVKHQDVDEIYFVRLALLIVLGACIIVGAGATFLLHCLETVQAGPIQQLQQHRHSYRARDYHHQRHLKSVVHTTR